LIGSGAGGAAGLYAIGLNAAGCSVFGVSLPRVAWVELAEDGALGVCAVGCELRVWPFWYAGSLIATFSSFCTTGLVRPS